MPDEVANTPPVKVRTLTERGMVDASTADVDAGGTTEAGTSTIPNEATSPASPHSDDGGTTDAGTTTIPKGVTSPPSSRSTDDIDSPVDSDDVDADMQDEDAARHTDCGSGQEDHTRDDLDANTLGDGDGTLHTMCDDDGDQVMDKSGDTKAALSDDSQAHATSSTASTKPVPAILGLQASSIRSTGAS